MADSSVNDTLMDLRPFSFSVAEKADLLEESLWLSDMSFQQVKTLARFMTVFQLKPDTLVFQEGDRRAYLCLICKGRVRVEKEDSRQTYQGIVELGKGHVFGEMSLLDGEPRSARVKTTSACTLLVLDKAQFLKLTDEYPQVALQVIWKIALIMSRRLRRTSGVLVDCLETEESAKARKGKKHE